MHENRKEEIKKKVMFIGLVIPVAMVIIGVSYAFFNVPAEKEPEKITIKSGDLVLTFKDNDETVENTEKTWNFGDSIEKELVIENTGTIDAYAKISWDNLINTYLEESLTYTLEEKNDDTGAAWKQVKTANTNVPRSESASTQILADHLLIPAGHTYTYRVKITFEDLENIDQTGDINAIFIAKFKLEQGVKENLKFYYDNVPKKVEVPNFANPATTDETEDGLFSMKDDYGTSYYFRGTAPNNYVKFGQDAEGQDMWWRIIRFNGDGTVRMQYDGAGTSGTNSYTRGFAMTSQKWNSNSNDAKYVGWMFGGANGRASTSKEQAQRNETDSPIKTKVDEWYKTNIVDTGYGNYVADSIFCNDRSTPGKSATGWTEDTGLGYDGKYTAYGAIARLGIYSEGPNYQNPKPQFTCPQKNDRFTVEAESGGNGALTYPVGLITADEIVTAGSGKKDTTNNSYYLYKESRYWSFSPYALVPLGNSAIFDIRNYIVVNNSFLSIAPVINIKAEYLDKFQGDGTIDNPYYLQI